MTTNIARWLLAMCAITAIALFSFGCGGGGGSGGGAASRVNLFVTDNLRTDYSTVFARIHSVQLISGTEATTVFSEPAGRTVNLLELNSGTNNLFLFMGSANVPAGRVFNQVRIEMANTMSALRTGQTTADTLNVQGTPLAGNVLVTINLSPPRSFSNNDPICLDFDLARFAIAGSNVTPFIVDLDPRANGVNLPARHVEDSYEGVVRNLAGTSPNFTFTLDMHGFSVPVQTSSATVFFNSNNTPNPQIANGTRVEIDGIFDVAGNLLRAWAVEVKVPGASSGTAEVEGTMGVFNAAAGTFSLRIIEAEGFMPTGQLIDVSTSAATIFRHDNGASMTRADFFALFPSVRWVVEVEGDIVGGVMVARKVKVDDEFDSPSDPNYIEATGMVASVSAETNTIVINLQEAQGFVPPPGGTLTVSIANTIEFAVFDGPYVSRAVWLSTLNELPANLRRVEFDGTFTDGVFHAREAEIIPLHD